MLPSYWIWSPQVYFPFSKWNQEVAPDTSWFFGSIPPQAGVGSVEKEVFEVASYGRQLGQIMDVLVPIAQAMQEQGALPPKARDALPKLTSLYDRIEEVKGKSLARKQDAALALLRDLERTDQANFRRLIQQFSASPARLPPG